MPASPSRSGGAVRRYAATIRTWPGWRAVRDRGGVRPSSPYTPRAPADIVLYQIVRDHFETFRADAARARDGDGLPRFIDESFAGSSGAASWRVGLRVSLCRLRAGSSRVCP